MARGVPGRPLTPPSGGVPAGGTPANGARAALHALLRRAVEVHTGEVHALVMAFTYFFFALASWFVLRPVRDAVAASSGATQLSWLFVGTLTLTLIANPFLSALVVRFPPRKFIPYAYHAIVVSLLVFYVLLRTIGASEGSTADIWIGRAFFIWLSVFVLFVTSLFWCFMADVFRSEQAKRLFGFIGVGGTLGSVAGSALTAFLAPRIGAVNLLLVSCALLEVAVIVITRFPSVSNVGADPAPTGALAEGASGVQRVPAEPAAPPPDTETVGGSIWTGFSRTVQSPYLAGIAVFLVLFTIGSTFLYFQQSAIVGEAYADRTSRTEVLAQIELAVQVLTVIAQVFLTGRIIRWFGLVTALAFLPVVSMIGFGALGAAPTFAAVAAFVILRRAGNFAFTNPAMEVLFTVVSREDKYKAKAFIETFVYRGGDQVGAWAFAGLTALGMGLTAIAWVAVPMSAVWMALSVWLARRHAVLADERGARTP